MILKLFIKSCAQSTRTRRFPWAQFVQSSRYFINRNGAFKACCFFSAQAWQQTQKLVFKVHLINSLTKKQLLIVVTEVTFNASPVIAQCTITFDFHYRVFMCISFSEMSALLVGA